MAKFYLVRVGDHLVRVTWWRMLLARSRVLWREEMHWWARLGNALRG